MSKRILKTIVAGLLLLSIPVTMVVASGAEEEPGGPVTVTVWKGSWWGEHAPVVEKPFNYSPET